MNKSNEISLLSRDLLLVVLFAFVIHGVAWGFWWVTEGRSGTILSVNQPFPISSPFPDGNHPLVGKTVVTNSPKGFLAETPPLAHSIQQGHQ